MSRGRRVRSATGIYHVMCRGNNKQDIFFSEGDKNKYYYLMSEAKKRYDFELYAFCFMSNHVHFIVREKTDSISEVMRSINSGYGIFVNRKHERVGHLFQSRFKSEPIENDRYLLSAVRYVHNNPVKACISTAPEEYYWNSYRGYLDSRHFADVLDREYILKFFEQGGEKNALHEFIGFTAKDDDILLCDHEKNMDELKNTYQNMVGNKPSEATIEETIGYMKNIGYCKKKMIDVTGLSDYSIRRIYNKV